MTEILQAAGEPPVPCKERQSGKNARRPRSQAQGTSLARSRTLDAVKIFSRSSDWPNRRSNSRQMVRCATESHNGVSSIEVSGPSSSGEISSALATTSITARVLASAVDWLLVSNASIRSPQHWGEAVILVERRGHLVLPRRDVFADDPLQTAIAAQLDSLVEQPRLHLAPDYATAR